MKKHFFLILVAFLTFFIFSPTLRWSYCYDPIDHFHIITHLKTSQDFWRYLFNPAVGNFMPLFNLCYFLCYKFFWINPFVFHALVLFALIVSGFFYIKILEDLTGSFVISVCSGLLAVCSTGYLSAFEVFASHFYLCLPFIFGTLYSLNRYIKTHKLKWAMGGFILAFFAPLVSSAGVLVGAWIILFTLLCMNPGKQSLKRNVQAVCMPLLGWAFGMSLFFMQIHKILVHTSFSLKYLSNAFVTLTKSIWFYALPLVTPFKKVSLFLAVFLSIMAIVVRKKIFWRGILFFTLWIVGNYIFIFIGRGFLGEAVWLSERYHVLSSFGLPAIYAFVGAGILKSEKRQWTKERKWGPWVLCFAMVLFAFYQYNTVCHYPRLSGDLQPLGRQWQQAVADYLKKSGKDNLELKNREINPERVLRGRDMKFYASFLLSSHLYRKIVWTSSDDKGFVDYVLGNKNKFMNLANILNEKGD